MLFTADSGRRAPAEGDEECEPQKSPAAAASADDYGSGSDAPSDVEITGHTRARRGSDSPGGQQRPEARERPWRCRACTFENVASFLLCGACDAVRHAPASPAGARVGTAAKAALPAGPQAKTAAATHGRARLGVKGQGAVGKACGGSIAKAKGKNGAIRKILPFFPG
jgi:hypothetical protein